MKIAVYAISKNESQFVQKFCESAKDADLILIADTGSTDNTVELAEECGATVYNIAIKPWRFDKAREAALALIPGDYDVCISLDLDEVLEPGWRDVIESVWKEDTTRLRYQFDWGSGIRFYSEKIHSRTGYFWKHPCHEYITPNPGFAEVWANTDELLITHHPDPTKSRGQYLPLLEMAIEEDPDCPRNSFYYARELVFNKKWDEGIVALEHYLNLPTAQWPHERCYAMRLKSQCYEALEIMNHAFKWARLAVAECPETREPWLDLAMLCYRTGQWEECLFASSKCLSITEKHLVYTMNPECWTERPYDVISLAYWNLGMKEKAIEYCRKALEFNPEDSRLLTNLEKMTEVQT
jgi:tetratricopeptide (TPR) repeat protein